MRHTPIIALPFAVLLCWSCGANKTTEPGVVPKQPSTVPLPFAALPGLFLNQIPALSNAEVLHYLPDSSLAAVVLKSPAAIASAIESTTIFREYADFYQDVARELNLPGGAHLLDVASWTTLGIDIQGPAGAAFLVQQDAVGVFFVTLSDPDLFIQVIADSARASGLPAPEKGQLASAQVLRFGPDAEIAFVSRAKVGFLVLADRASDLPLAVQTLAGVGNTTSLSDSGRTARAFADLDYGEDLAGFVAFDSIAERIEADMRKHSGGEWYTEEIGRLETAIELAKTEQRSQTEIDDLEKELEGRLVDHNRYQLRRTGEARIGTDILHPLGTLAFGVDLDGRETRARLQLQPRAGSLPASLLTRSAKPLALPSRLAETPLFVLAAQVSSEAAHQLVELLLQAEGETRSMVAASFRKLTGLELVDALVLIEGELSMAFTFNRQAFAGEGDSADLFAGALGLHLLLELNDQGAAAALLAKAMASPKLKRYAVTRDGKAGLEIPSFNRRKIRIDVDEGFVEARSVGALVEPLVWTKAESELISSPDNAALMLIDPIMLAWSLVGVSNSSYADNAVSSRSGSLSPAAKARLAEIQKEKRTLRIKSNALRTEQMLAGSKASGRLISVARLQPSGLAFLALVRSESANLGRAFQRLLETLSTEIESARLGKRSPLDEIDTQIRSLDTESWRLIDDSSP